MSYCVYCGSQLTDGAKFCNNCGAKQEEEVSVEAVTAVQPAQEVQFSQSAAYQPVQAVAPVSTGGLIAWGIITLLLCTIPGIVALCKVGGINKARTYDEQQKALSSTKTWCIVGTILGLVALIFTVAANS